MYLCILLLVPLHLAVSKKLITFRASKAVTRSLPTSEGSFASWFAKPTTPSTILTLNPGLDRIEQIATGSFKGYLAPIQFPGVTVRSIIDFKVIQADEQIDIICEQGSLQQSFEGPKVFVAIVSKLIPDIASRTSFILNPNEGQLTNEAELEITFAVPSWFPLNPQAVEEGGSKTIQTSMEKDLDGILDKIFTEYLNQSTPALETWGQSVH